MSRTDFGRSLLHAGQAAGRCLSAALFALPFPAAAGTEAVPEDARAAVAYFADKTFRFSSETFGTGVLYADERGRSFLWFPGQIKVAWGIWDVSHHVLHDASGKIVAYDYLCMRFSGNRSDSSGIALFRPRECLELDRFKDDVIERMDGDILGLSTGRVPCRFCDAGRPLAELRGP